MAIVESLGISIARKNTVNETPEKPSRFLVFLTATILDLSNKLIARTAKKDYRYRRFVESFEAKIQLSTKDGYIHRFLVFDGEGGFTYCKGILEDADATVTFTSVKHLVRVPEELRRLQAGHQVQLFQDPRKTQRAAQAAVLDQLFQSQGQQPKEQEAEDPRVLGIE
jgi:hypothetical protein